MLRKTILAVVLAAALAAAGVAAAAAVTRQNSTVASSSATAGKVTLHKTAIGKVLATGSGRTLYLFMADHKNKSACYGKCATFWPPLMKKGKVAAAAGVKAKLLGTTKRKNGKLQVTYKGHPLYLFKLDKGAGQVTGQRQNFFGGIWYAVSSSGSANKKAPPPPGTTSTGTTTTNPYSTTYRY